MAKRKTTPEERNVFIEEQRARGATYPRDMSFIDREGNIVHPLRGEALYRKKLDIAQGYAVKINKQYDALVSKYGKDSPEVYKFERQELEMLRGRKYKYRASRRLEGGLAIIGIIAGLSFLSANITGNVIGSMTNSSSNIIGASLLIIGLIAGFFYFKSRK